MRMAVGVNCPYSDRGFEPHAWRLLDRLQPDEITLTSFISESDTDWLAAEFSHALFHVRPRTGPQNQSWAETYRTAGANILTYRSWETERSLWDCLRTLLAHLPAGAHERGGPRVTVLLGNEPTLEWAPAYPTTEQVKRCADEYADWFHEQADLIVSEFAGAVGIAVAPAAEGDDFRERMWISEVMRAGCYDRATAFADHNYFAVNDGPLNDPRWGSRAYAAMQMIGWDVAYRGRARNTETNDNGDLFSRDSAERAQRYADYITWAGNSGIFESVSLFTLPGAHDDNTKPAWWFLTDQIIDAVIAARDSLPQLPPVETAYTPKPDPIVPPPAPAPPVAPETPQEDHTVPEQSDPLYDAMIGGQTLTADQLHAKRWQAMALPRLPAPPAYNPEFGFEAAWRKPEYSWIGSPLTVNEDKLIVPDGEPLPARVFANAVAIWRPGAGIEILR